MTCFIYDADAQMKAEFGNIASVVSVSRLLLYVDDTLILESNPVAAQRMVDIIREKGFEYGLEFNEKKLEMMTINGNETILAANGSRIKQKDSMVYLGSILSADGRIQSELNRRIGSAGQAFNELERLWKHANVSVTRKLEIFESCVISRLMYGLQTCWLNEAELSRLDAYYCKCLRRILKIPPSFESRVPNAEFMRKLVEY